MYAPDKLGRVRLDEDTYFAPFGFFDKDYRFVIEYLRDPYIAERTLYDNFTEKDLLWNYGEYLKNGIGWIGMHKNKRAGYIILEKVSNAPVIYAVHGGMDRKLFGKGMSKKVIDFVKYYVFDVMKAVKLEGYELKPNSLLRGFYTKIGGMEKECELKDRLLINGVPSPITIYGITKEMYYGRRRREVGANPSGAGTSTNKSSKSRARKNRRSKRKGRR
jgi:RimJ/RimL family protein N-acetyltransferase